MLYISATKKATLIDCILADKEYLPIPFSIQKRFWWIFDCWDISRTFLGRFWKYSYMFWVVLKLIKFYSKYHNNHKSLWNGFLYKTNGRIFSITFYENCCCTLFYKLSWNASKMYFENEEITRLGLQCQTPV